MIIIDTKRLQFLLAPALLLLLASCQSVPREPSVVQFALIGDNPYTDFNVPKYKRMIEQINAREEIAWTIHVGDLKSSGMACSDETFQKLYDLNDRFLKPLVLTPGDNDWFDCARVSAGQWDRRERLARFREMFYPATGLAKSLPLVSQASSGEFTDYVENVYWVDHKVVYGMLHLVGITGTEGGLDLNQELIDASVAWLDQIFAVAKAENASGVFLATQTDPWFFSVERGLLTEFCETCDFVRKGYEALDKALLKHAKTFRKPIVIATGDTHIFRIDKPLYDGELLVENFTRVEVFGNPSVHWIRVVVNPQANQLFEIHQEIIEENLGYGWHPMDKAGEPDETIPKEVDEIGSH